jgi:hypothetical protein
VSVNPRLAAALVTVTQVLRQVDAYSSEVDELVAHMWRWPTVRADSLVDWEHSASPLLEWALGGRSRAGPAEALGCRSSSRRFKTVSLRR